MRKNSLKMEEMRPELEKLQKQYADNKDLYSQKMMALYKKNGYSMFGACLPTILTLVIFIVAINAFTDYSKYQNKMDFYHMSQSYNNVVYAGFDIDNDYITRNEKGEIVVKDQLLFDDEDGIIEVDGENSFIIYSEIKLINENYEDPTKNTYNLEMHTTNGYMVYKRNYTLNEGKPVWGSIKYELIGDAHKLIGQDSLLKCDENNNLKNSAGKDFETAYSETVASIEKLNEENKDVEGWENKEIPTKEQYADTFLNDIQSYRAAQRYREEQSSFLWIKNIWVTDSPSKHPVESSWDSFKGTHSYDGNNIGEAGYNKLIEHLDKETSEPNGYFILVALTALSSLLTQIVQGKSQKASMELQTVDGQGAQTQKVMKWMMPIMMAFFAFMYTSAFSIYIILSSIISVLTTFLINFIVDRKFKKESANKKNETIRGRVYTPKEEKKEEPKNKKNTTPDADFLSGKADKTGRIRGKK